MLHKISTQFRSL